MKGDSVITKKKLADLHDFSVRIVDSAPLSIILINKQGVIVFTNKFYSIFSGSKKPLHRNISDIPFFVKEKLVEKYRKLLKDGVSFKKADCETVNSKKETKYISIIAVPLKDKKGNPEFALSMASDVTNVVLAKKELQNFNAILKEKVKEKTLRLQESNKKLKKSVYLRSQFIAEASHELRTPLAIAKLNLELVEKQLPIECTMCKNLPTLGEILFSVNEEINKAADIISDLTFFSNIRENYVKEIRLENLNLNEMMCGLIKRLKTLSGLKKIELILENKNSEIFINGDRKNLEKMFSNILRNSIKYGKNNGWVRVSLSHDLENRVVNISISDNGIGIPKKDLPYIFDRFYRSDLSKKTGEGGFGIGLAICKWIVLQHKGSINVESEVGKGSVFNIALPLINF